MKLKSTKLAQLTIARRQPQTQRSGRAPALNAFMNYDRLTSLRLDDLVSLSDAFSTMMSHSEISCRFGVTVEEVDIFSQIFFHHMGNNLDQVAQIFRRFKRSTTAELHAYRRLFASVARSIEPITATKANDFKLFLDSINGLSPPRAWSVDAKDAVFRLFTVAQAGACHLQEYVIPGKHGEEIGFNISWAPLRDDVDMNADWVTAVTLALLRARALFKLKSTRRSKFIVD